MCMARSVQFKEIALFLNDDAKVDSNLRRIQSFFADYELNYKQIAIIMICFIPEKKYRLCIDRTNWKFGSVDINIFGLTVYYKGTSIPILFELLEKCGNSNQNERIDLLGRFVKLFGKKCIKSLTADREFIGESWFNFLIKNKIDFHIRIPKSLYLQVDGQEKRGDALLAKYGKVFLKNIKINQQTLHLGMDYSVDKNGKDDPLLVLTNDPKHDPLDIYRERWSIEVFFQSVKERGFDLESTHLQNLDRLSKLFALTGIAFASCLTVGCYADACEKKIEVKNHGYKANSFFRHGLDICREALRNPLKFKDRLVYIADLIINFVNSVYENQVINLLKIKTEKIIM